jgi:hypothetical protein
MANATRLCEAKFGSLVLYEGDAFRVVAMHNVPPVFEEERRQNPLRHPGPEYILSRVVRTKQAVQDADVTRGQTSPGLAALAGARTVLAVPMLKQNELIGRSVSIVRRSGHSQTSNRRAGRHRHREHPPAERAARIAAAANRHRRRTQNHQPPVLETLIENATKLCAAEQGFIFRSDGELYHLAVDYNASAGGR